MAQENHSMSPKLGVHNMSEKLCLQWNDFKDSVNTAFGSLRGDSDFTDVTLASEDGQQMEVHKVILAASSPFFRNILKKNKHSHPLIYMRKVKSEDLVAIIDFLYCGEANVYQENLDSFLAIAEELQLKGLMATDEPQKPEVAKTTDHKKNIKPVHRREHALQGPLEPSAQSYLNKSGELFGTVALTQNFSGDLHELDNTVKSMMTKTDQKHWNTGHGGFVYSCNVCGKEGQSMNVQHHIESNHLEGISLPCNLCEKTYRSRSSLQNHKRDGHNKKLF